MKACFIMCVWARIIKHLSTPRFSNLMKTKKSFLHYPHSNIFRNNLSQVYPKFLPNRNCWPWSARQMISLSPASDDNLLKVISLLKKTISFIKCKYQNYLAGYLLQICSCSEGYSEALYLFCNSSQYNMILVLY